MTATTAAPVARRSGEGRRRARVLHVLPDLQIGGGQTIVLNHVRHADRDRFDVDLVTLGGPDEMGDRFRETGCTLLTVPYRPGAGVVTAARLARLIRRRGVDVVHVHSVHDRRLGQLAALATGVPVVGHLHAEWNHLGSMAPHDAGAARRLRARAAATVRDGVERRTVRHYVAESERVREIFSPLVAQPLTVLRQAVPVDAFDAARAAGARRAVRRELGLAERAPVLATVARLVEGKGHDDLFPLLAEIRRDVPDAVLLLVGDGPLRSRFEQAAARHGVADAVRFLGNRSDVPAVLVASDVFVFPSYSEGFGLAVLEAMAAGLPVAAYDLPPFSEFARSGVTAHLVPLGAVPSLTEAARRLLLDAEEAARFGGAGLGVVRERYAPDTVARVFEGVYDDVLGNQGRV